jgi:PAS domain S-box-containing protein
MGVLGGRSLRALLVDDSVDDAALLVRELRRGGYDPIWQRVDTVASLERALDASWDVILCDYQMQGLDAPTAISLVRGRDIATPCIIVSSDVGEEHAVAALQSGAQDFVLKDRLTRLVPAIERELRDSERRIKHATSESTLHATEASFRAAFELIPDGVLVCRNGLVVHANGSATTMLAAAAGDDLVHRSLFDLFAPSDQKIVRERMQEMHPSNAPVPIGELTMVRLDGRLINVETTAMSVLFDGEEAILSVVRDVTARRELVAQTIQVDRMLAVGTLAAGVGHEINNPLAYVMANVAYASDQIARVKLRIDKPADQDPSTRALVRELSEVLAVLSEVDDGARRIRNIAKDLNTFARGDEELHLVDVRALADSALRMAASEVRYRARVVRQYEEVPPVRANASRMSQVFLNLVINAAHAIAKGAYDSNEIAVRIRSDGGNVVVEVCDTGCGIPPEDRARLFTPFFTTKPAGQGTGLGLSISKRIVCSFGGDIEVDSTPGHGTTMRVILPAVRDAPSSDVSPPQALALRGQLLFIDDERLVGRAFQRALSREHDVVVLQTAAEALSRLAAGELFDAIFCDVNMPTTTGIDLYETIERSMPQLASRVVLITGGGHELAMKRFTDSHKTLVLEKPLDLDRVRAVVAQMLSGTRSALGDTGRNG